MLSTVNANDVTLLGNLAQGGDGGSGGGTGGTGAGGAAYNDSGSIMNISNGLLSLDAVSGGSGGSGGGSGGAGLGGAIDNAGPDDLYSPALPGAVLSLVDTVVIGNLAQEAPRQLAVPTVRASVAAFIWPPAAPPRSNRRSSRATSLRLAMIISLAASESQVGPSRLSATRTSAR